MGECQQGDWQVREPRSVIVTAANNCHQMAARSVRERMDHLYNNPDMSDLTITASDHNWGWGQTSQEFIVRFDKEISHEGTTKGENSKERKLKG